MEGFERWLFAFDLFVSIYIYLFWFFLVPISSPEKKSDELEEALIFLQNPSELKKLNNSEIRKVAGLLAVKKYEGRKALSRAKLVEGIQDALFILKEEDKKIFVENFQQLNIDFKVV